MKKVSVFLSGANVQCIGKFDPKTNHLVISAGSKIRKKPSQAFKKKEKRIKLKIKAILSSILFLCTVLFTKFKYKSSIFTSFILCVISINPITYKVLKTPRNNYRN